MVNPDSHDDDYAGCGDGGGGDAKGRYRFRSEFGQTPHFMLL